MSTPKLPRCPGCHLVWWPDFASQQHRCQCGKVLRFTYEHRQAGYQSRQVRHQQEHAQWRARVDADRLRLAEWQRLNAPTFRSLRRLRTVLAGMLFLSITLLLSLTAQSASDTVKAPAAAASALTIGLTVVLRRKQDNLLPPTPSAGPEPPPPQMPLTDDGIAREQLRAQEASRRAEEDRKRRVEQQEWARRAAYWNQLQQQQRQQARPK